MLAVSDPLPQRPDQAEEAGGLNDGPAGGLEFLSGEVFSHSMSFFKRGLPDPGGIQVGGHFINGRHVVVKQNGPPLR